MRALLTQVIKTKIAVYELKGDHKARAKLDKIWAAGVRDNHTVERV